MASTALEILIKLRDEASQGLNKFAGSLEKHASAIRGVGIGMTAVGGGLALVTRGFVQAAADAEQTKVAFTTMLGSAEKAVQFTKELAEFASKTPFELKGLEQASKQLLAYGISQTQVLPNLKVLGDIASGVGQDKLPDLIRAFGQVSAKGKLMAQELNQFAEAGVPLREMLAKDLKMSLEEFSQELDKGNLKISFGTVQKALENLTGEGGRFQNMMDQQSKTFTGLMSNMRDQIDLFMRQGGQPLMEGLKDIVKNIIAVIIKVNEWAKAHPELTKVLGIAAAALAALMLVLGPILVMLPGIVIALKILGAAFVALTGPVGLVIAIIAALVAIGIILYKNWDTIQAKTIEVWNNIVSFLDNAWNTIKDTAAAVWNGVTSFFTAVWDGIVAIHKFALTFLIGLVITMFEAMGIDIVKVFQSVVAFLENTWELIKTAFTASLDAIKVAWEFVWGNIRDFIAPIWETIKTTVANGWNWLIAKFGEFTKPLGKAWDGLWQGLTAGVTIAWEGVKSVVKSSINWIIDQVNRLIDAINSVAAKGGRAIGVSAPQIPRVPMLAAGGIVTKPTLAMIGEAGPEAVVPLSKMGRFGGGDIIINITGNTISSDLDIRRLADAVSDAIRDKLAFNQRVNV